MDESTGAQDDRPSGNRVVVGVDGSPGSRAALVWALTDAARRGAALLVLSTFPVEVYWADPLLVDTGHIDAVRTETETRARTLLDEVRADPEVSAQPGVADVPVEVVVGPGHPAARLVQESDEADLLVVGSRGRGAVRSTILGSVALHTVTHSRCPVVVVRPSAVAALTPPRVVVGVDGSEESRAALTRAVDEAARLGGQVQAVAAYSVANTWSETFQVVVPPVAHLREAAQRGVEQLVLDVGETSGRDLVDAVRVVPVEGAAGDALVREAEGAELLVVGSRGRGAVRGMLLGSVALHCVIHAPCPVLVVPPARRGAPAS